MPYIILQLDFDGTLTESDVNEALFLRFVGSEWTSRIEAASKELTRDPASPALIDALREASIHLQASEEECLAFVRASLPLRPGLTDLIDTADRLALETHIVSYGFEFYIRDYLRTADVEDRVTLHAGRTARRLDGGLDLTYKGPDGGPVHSDWKLRWLAHFRAAADEVAYAGDGSSDVAPAQHCAVVFARDSLLRGLEQSSYSGRLRQFETLHDIARGLEDLFG
jgi:HAD superfamily phosphoserine phosphatase-like hydrolase